MIKMLDGGLKTHHPLATIKAPYISLVKWEELLFGHGAESLGLIYLVTFQHCSVVAW